MYDLFGLVSNGTQDDEGSPFERYPNMAVMSFSGGGGGAWELVQSAYASVGEEAVRSPLPDLLAAGSPQVSEDAPPDTAFVSAEGGRDDDFFDAFAADDRSLNEIGRDDRAGRASPDFALDIDPASDVFDRFSVAAFETRGLNHGRAAFDNSMDSLLSSFDDDFFVLPRWMMRR